MRNENEELKLYALSLQKEFHLPEPIRFVDDFEAKLIKGHSQKAVGWYDTKTDVISVNLDQLRKNCAGADFFLLRAELGKTIFHEAIGHYGLRLLLGSRFSSVMTHVYDHASTPLKERFEKKRGDLLRVQNSAGKFLYQRLPVPELKVLVVEEVLSDMAEGLYERRPSQQRYVGLMSRAISAALRAFRYVFCEVGEKDVEKMLERSYRKVKSRSLFGKLVDRVAGQHSGRFSRALAVRASKRTDIAHKSLFRKALNVDLGPLKWPLIIFAPYCMLAYYGMKAIFSSKEPSPRVKSGPRSRQVREILQSGPDVSPREPAESFFEESLVQSAKAKSAMPCKSLNDDNCLEP